ncbi:hypothetical protein ACH5RR_026252 [Cinchona calisaya]|uniref:Uncharacterized protein n=1 Tax=Cinchona calisaya TaxID=153742 RepID=A0ABD2Z5C9_9GENT
MKIELTDSPKVIGGGIHGESKEGGDGRTGKDVEKRERLKGKRRGRRRSEEMKKGKDIERFGDAKCGYSRSTDDIKKKEAEATSLQRYVLHYKSVLRHSFLNSENSILDYCAFS